MPASGIRATTAAASSLVFIRCLLGCQGYCSTLRASSGVVVSDQALAARESRASDAAPKCWRARQSPFRATQRGDSRRNLTTNRHLAVANQGQSRARATAPTRRPHPPTRCRRALRAALADRPRLGRWAAFWFLLVGVLLVVDRAARAVSRSPAGEPGDDLPAGGFRARAPRCSTRSSCIRCASSRCCETITEIALLIALFTVGIKLRVPIGDWRWSLPLRLATVSMVLTIAGIAAAAMLAARLPPGAGAGARRGARAHRSGARLRRAAAQPAGSRHAALRADRRGRAQRRHRVSVRLAGPRAARPA